jgi:hypothetical protein
MSDVKRDDICGHDGYPEPDDSGYYVTYDDYAALQARLAEVEAQRNEAAMLLQLHMQRAERAEAALATARRDALERAAQFVESHEVGVHPRTGYVVAPSMIEGTQGTHAGMAYATAIRALIAQEDTQKGDGE